MSFRATPIRALALGLAVVSALLTSAVAAATPHPLKPTPTPKCDPRICDQRPAGQRLTDPTLEKGSFIGKISVVVGPVSSPSGFTVQLGTDSTDIRMVAKTIEVAKSAEADVEGLVRGDYVSVRAKRLNRVWYATRVVFDVRPVLPLRLISGSIVRISPDGKRVLVKADAGRATYLVQFVRQTRFWQDGRLVDIMQMQLGLAKGMPLQVLVRKDRLWTAFEVYERTITLEV